MGYQYFRYLKSTLGNIKLIKQFMTDEGSSTANLTDKEVNILGVVLVTIYYATTPVLF